MPSLPSLGSFGSFAECVLGELPLFHHALLSVLVMLLWLISFGGTEEEDVMITWMEV